MINNYDVVLEVIESYEDEDILKDFKSEFKINKYISECDFYEFNMKYIDDMSEEYYIKLNWKYIESGGKENVFNKLLKQHIDYDNWWKTKDEKRNYILNK
tara:strand:- start:1935 stop:2234 length:300 start_codon:yes stop_codon:yes gene_type:complete